MHGMQKLKGSLFDIRASRRGGADAMSRAGLPRVAPPVLLMGAIHAWFALFHTRIEPTAALDPLGTQVAFDLALSLTGLVCALLCRRIAPASGHPGIVAAASLGAAVATAASAVFAPVCAPAFLACGVTAHVGVALVGLMWCEFIACSSPVRAVLYVAVSSLVGEVIRLLAIGFVYPYLVVVTSVLPVASALALVSAFRGVPAADPPAASGRAGSLPTGLLAVFALYSLVYGVVGKSSGSSVLITSLGVVLPGAMVYASVATQGGRFGFEDLYRFGLPCVICGSIIFAVFPGLDPTLANFFVSLGYRTCYLLVCLVLSNISYSLGTSALYLFGAYEAVRYAAVAAGKGALLASQAGLLPEGALGLVSLAASLVAVIAFLHMFRGKGHVSALWDVDAELGGDASSTEGASLRGLPIAANRAAAAWGLSDRETETLHLLLRGMTYSEIAEELFIAEGTVKSHVSRIYRKAGVSSRRELVEAVAAAPGATG